MILNCFNQRLNLRLKFEKIFSILIFFLWAAGTQAANEMKTVDISNGLVFPADRTSIRENAAALSGYSNRNLELTLNPPINGEFLQVQAAYNQSLGKMLGFGFSATHQASSANLSSGSQTLYAGLGFDLALFKLGFMGQYLPSNSQITWQLGLLLPLKNLTLGFVLPNPFNLNTWRLGLGLNLGALLAEIDLHNLAAGSYLIQTSLSFLSANKYQVQIGASQAILSSNGFSLSGPIELQAGLFYWPANSLGLGVLYQHEAKPWLLSLKWKF